MITACPKCGRLYDETAEEADNPSRQCNGCYYATHGMTEALAAQQQEDRLSVLDLNTWTEEVGMASIHGLFCSRCRAPIPETRILKSGQCECTACGLWQSWRVIQTPLGKAWQSYHKVQEGRDHN